MKSEGGRFPILAVAVRALGISVTVWLPTSAALAAKVTFPSETIANMGQAALGPSNDHVLISGELGFPKTKAERYPAVVIVHASGGYGPANEGWFAAELNKAGFATLTYDSFIARKWGVLTKGGNPSGTPSALADAFAALNFPAGETRIDPSRVSIIGFSFGGEVAHLTSFERFRTASSPDHRFAAHVSFYPGFGFGTPAGPQAYTGSPILFLLGEKDDTVPTAKVQEYFAYLKKAATNAPIETVTYPGAYHAWTNPNPPKPKFFPDFISNRNCPLVLVGETRTRLLVDGQEKPLDPKERQRCLDNSRGYTMGFNAGVRAKSLADTVAFLRKIP